MPSAGHAGQVTEQDDGPSSKALWIAFLKEFAAEADARGSRASFAYHKAGLAIQKASQAFVHPSELIVLTGIGPTTISKLTQRLEEWCKVHHVTMPVKAASGSAPASSSAAAEGSTRGRKRPARAEASGSTPASRSVPKKTRRQLDDTDDFDLPLPGPVDDLIGFRPGDNESTDEEDHSDDGNGQSRAQAASKADAARNVPARRVTNTSKASSSAPKPKKKKAPTAPHRYVPHFRTGAYGILLGLLTQTPSANDEVFLTKSQLIPLAQPWCDSDYIVSSKGTGSRGGPGFAARVPTSITAASAASSRTADSAPGGATMQVSYTAWSSMKTLISKGLVYQMGNPPRYCLTEDGWELASEMKNVSDGQGASHSGTSASPERPEVRQQAASSSSCRQRNTEVPEQPRVQPSGLRIPVTKPGLFSSSDPPSSSPHEGAIAGARAKASTVKAKSTSRPEIVVLSDASQPESDHERGPLTTARQGSMTGPAALRARPFERTLSHESAHSSGATATRPPRSGVRGKEHDYLHNNLSVPPKYQDAPSGSRTSLLPDEGAMPGSQQSNAISISDSDDEMEAMTAGKRGLSSSRQRLAPQALEDGSVTALDDADTTMRATDSRSTPGTVLRTTSSRRAATDALEGSRHPAASTSKVATLSRPTTAGKAPRARPHGTDEERPQHRHARLSQAIPRREIEVNGLGWQAQMQAEIGSQSQSQSQDLDSDDGDRPSHSDARTACKQRHISVDSDSDIDIAGIMRNVENDIAARTGRKQRTGSIPSATRHDVSLNKTKQGQPSQVVLSDDDSDVDKDEGSRLGSTLAEDMTGTRARLLRTGPRDSLPAVPQPLLPGMAAVKEAADFSFDMFLDDSASSPHSTPYSTRLLPSCAALQQPPTPGARLASSQGTNGTQDATATGKPPEWAVPKFTPTVWSPGSYDIILLLDTREIKNGSTMRATQAGSSHVNSMGVEQTLRGPRCHMSRPLADKGVPVEVRALELGDALWIARRKDGHGAETDEVVLDYIVERKRLDDLVQSIPDGRWKEQKFRLSLSGLSKIFYLIEDFDVEQQMRMWGPQIATAISSTQVIDGFFIQRTAGMEASLEWLRKMHLVICQMHENKSLHILPDSALSRPTYLRLQTHLRRTQPLTPHHVTFASYRALNAKSGSVTVGEVWARMLLCVRGMSEEKVGEAIRVWRTGREWWDSCRAILDEGGQAVDLDVEFHEEEDATLLDEDIQVGDNQAQDLDEDDFSLSDDEGPQKRHRKVEKSKAHGKAKAKPPAATKTQRVQKGKAPRAALTRSASDRGKALMAEHVGGMYLGALKAAGVGTSAGGPSNAYGDLDATSLAASLAQFDSRKKVGNALSAKVWEVWTKESYN